MNEPTSYEPKRYVVLWRRKLPADVTSIDDLIVADRDASALLEAMRADGVTLERFSDFPNCHVRLVTTRHEIASRYQMIDEAELLLNGLPDGPSNRES